MPVHVWLQDWHLSCKHSNLWHSHGSSFLCHLCHLLSCFWHPWAFLFHMVLTKILYMHFFNVYIGNLWGYPVCSSTCHLTPCCGDEEILEFIFHSLILLVTLVVGALNSIHHDPPVLIPVLVWICFSFSFSFPFSCSVSQNAMRSRTQWSQSSGQSYTNIVQQWSRRSKFSDEDKRQFG